MERDGIMSGVVKVVMLVLSAVGVFAVLMLLMMASQGMFQKERLKRVIGALKGEKEKVEKIEIIPEKERMEMKVEREQRELTFRKKGEELEHQEHLLLELQRDIQAKLEKLNAERLEMDKLKKKETDQGVQVASVHGDAAFRESVQVFSKMDPENIVKILKTWEDGKIRAMLRALKPSTAAEVVTLLAADPDFNTQDAEKNEKKLRINRILLE